MKSFQALIVLIVLSVPSLQGKLIVYPVAPELRSDHFHVTINGKEAPVALAATTYYFLNFSLTGKTLISISAKDDAYWSKGVEVQPWRWGIRPLVNGRTIKFQIDRPMKLSISRPGDHAAGAEMLFLFANAPEMNAPRPSDPDVHYYGPGAYHESIDAQNGQVIYLAPGAVVFGGLNIWGVENVKVLGRGTIVYDGPQNPNNDEGWMHKRDWHGIVMDHARHIEIDGITVVVRSRTWMIQMLSSRDVKFNNVKVIGGCPGNANQDGMDWLGGGDAVIRDSFFRASDDIFAMYGNWLGYDPQSISAPGETVDHILVEDSVLSTSISNVVRVSWPGKVFDSHNFSMRNSDVINMGEGGCKIPFSLLEIWDDPGGKGLHQNYSFENIRLEDWYSLLQLRQQNAGISNVTLRDVWSLGGPSLTPSVLSGDITDVKFENTKLSGKAVTANEDIPLEVESGASAPAYRPDNGPHASFSFTPSAVKPGTRVTFEASDPISSIKKYEWIFGDGTTAQGRVTHHRFPDTKGTFVDSSRRFRVLLKVTDSAGREDWSYQPLVVADAYAPARPEAQAGIRYRYYERETLTLADLAGLAPSANGTANALDIAKRKRDKNYAFVFEGVLDAPVEGGYTFLLLGNDEGELQVDSRVIAVSPVPKGQVCGMEGNMVQLATGSVGLAAGKHTFRVAMTHSAGPDGFAVKWQGPGLALSDLRPYNVSLEPTGRQAIGRIEDVTGK